LVNVKKDKIMIGWLKENEKLGIRKVKKILKEIQEFPDYQNTKNFMEKADGIEAMALGNKNKEGLFIVFLVRKSDELYRELIGLCESYISGEEDDPDIFKEKYNSILGEILAYGSMFGED